MAVLPAAAWAPITVTRALAPCTATFTGSLASSAGGLFTFGYVGAQLGNELVRAEDHCEDDESSHSGIE